MYRRPACRRDLSDRNAGPLRWLGIVAIYFTQRRNPLRKLPFIAAVLATTCCGCRFCGTDFTWRYQWHDVTSPDTPVSSGTGLTRSTKASSQLTHPLHCDTVYPDIVSHTYQE